MTVVDERCRALTGIKEAITRQILAGERIYLSAGLLIPLKLCATCLAERFPEGFLCFQVIKHSQLHEIP